MNRHNLPLARHAAMDMSATGWVMIANSSNCLISRVWLASTAVGDSKINTTFIQIVLLNHIKLFNCRGGNTKSYHLILKYSLKFIFKEFMQLPSVVYNVLLQKFHTLIIIHRDKTDGINGSISID